MKKIFGIGIFVLKLAFVGLFIAWNLAMNIVGIIICAITAEG